MDFNFNFKEFKNGKIAVHCNTKEKAKDFIKQCIKQGINQWEDLSDLNIDNTNWIVFTRDTCYNYCNGLIENGFRYDDINYFKQYNYKIVKWEIKERTMEDKIKEIQKQIEKQKEQSQQKLDKLQNKLEKLQLKDKREKIKNINEDIGIVVKHDISKIQTNTVDKDKFQIYFYNSNENKYVSEYKRKGNKIICKYYIRECSGIIGIGTANCSLTDNFNYYNGMNLATLRAKSDFYKKSANMYAKYL